MNTNPLHVEGYKDDGDCGQRLATAEREFRRSGGGRSQNEKLASIFLARPNEWIEMTELGNQIGAWAVHSRVSFLRRKHGMTIECDVERSDESSKRLARYRYIPAQRQFAEQSAKSLPPGSAD